MVPTYYKIGRIFYLWSTSWLALHDWAIILGIILWVQRNVQSDFLAFRLLVAGCATAVVLLLVVVCWLHVNVDLWKIVGLSRLIDAVL